MFRKFVVVPGSLRVVQQCGAACHCSGSIKALLLSHLGDSGVGVPTRGLHAGSDLFLLCSRRSCGHGAEPAAQQPLQLGGPRGQVEVYCRYPCS